MFANRDRREGFALSHERVMLCHQRRQWQRKIRPATMWQYKQYILKEEVEMKRLQLELLSQSILHSEKDKLASISYDYDTRTILYEAYA